MEVEEIESIPAGGAPPKYGPTGDGEYLTPYNTTIFYREHSLFETAVAVLCGGQAIPLVPAPDYNALAESCEYITPEVVIFDDRTTSVAINNFLARGFKFVHIFTTDTTKITPDDADVAEYAYFSADTIHEHVNIREVASTFLLEHIVVNTFHCDRRALSITPDRARRLVAGLRLHADIHIVEYLQKFMKTCRGFDIIEELVVAGQATELLREQMANAAISTSPIVDAHDAKIMMFAGVGHIWADIQQLLPLSPANADFAAIIQKQEISLFNIAATRGGGGSNSAQEKLRAIVGGEAYGGHGYAWATADEQKIINLGCRPPQ